jgi:hypothetical protein
MIRETVVIFGRGRRRLICWPRSLPVTISAGVSILGFGLGKGLLSRAAWVLHLRRIASDPTPEFGLWGEALSSRPKTQGDQRQLLGLMQDPTHLDTPLLPSFAGSPFLSLIPEVLGRP